MRRRLASFVGVVFACISYACAGPVASGPRAAPPPLLVDEHVPVFVRSEAGIVEIDIDGTERRVIAEKSFDVIAVSADGRVVALTDAVHGVWIARDGQSPVRIDALRGRHGIAAMSADGTLLAVGAWAWATAPDPSWLGGEDDRVFLIDTRTLAVGVMPRHTVRRIEDIAFSNDGSTVWIRLFGDFAQRIDVARRERAPVLRWSNEPVYSGRPDPGALSVCRRTGEHLEPVTRGPGNAGLDITSAELGRRQLVSMTAPSEYEISAPFFTPSCRHAVFQFNRRVWVVDVETGRVGMLAQGWEPFGVPAVEPEHAPALTEEGELHRHEWTPDERPETVDRSEPGSGHGYVGAFFGPIALTRVRAGDERSGATWVAFGMSGTLIHLDGSALRRVDLDASLGTGKLELDGNLRFDTVSAYRILSSAWSPYVGIGLGGYLRGNDAFTHSELTLPEGRLGVHWSHALGVVDLGAGIAPVLIGRFTTDAGRDKLGDNARLAAYAALGYDWAFFRGGLSHVFVEDSPVTSADGHWCVNSSDLVLCATADYAVRPLTQGGTTDAMAVGLSLGFGTVL